MAPPKSQKGGAKVSYGPPQNQPNIGLKCVKSIDNLALLGHISIKNFRAFGAVYFSSVKFNYLRQCIWTFNHNSLLVCLHVHKKNSLLVSDQPPKGLDAGPEERTLSCRLLSMAEGQNAEKKNNWNTINIINSYCKFVTRLKRIYWTTASLQHKLNSITIH